MKKIPYLVSASLLLLLVGCAAVSKIDPGKNVSIDGEYTVQAPNVWAKVRTIGPDLWTVDGMLLQTLRFVTALEDGDTLFIGHDPAKLPKFKSTMGPLEIVDFFRASAPSATNFESRNFRPDKFGSHSGFRFEFSYLTKDGLAMEGFANGALIDKKLYMIIYSGARQHYFNKHREDAEKIVSSIVFS